MKKNLLYLVFLLFACDAHKTSDKVKWPFGVKYELFVMSFADSDGDGRGDFKGLTSKLDYFTDLGVNGLMLMPIMPSDTSNNRVIDYKDIDANCGTLDDFKKFLSEAHLRDIKVTMDLGIGNIGNDEILDVAQFWLNEVGVDGFRVNTTRHFLSDDSEEEDASFWLWFKNEVKEIKPDVYLVAEARSQAEVNYLKGFPSLFNLGFGQAITNVVANGSDTIGLVQRYKEISDAYKSSTADYLDANLIRNHSQSRTLTVLNENLDKAKISAALLLTMPGTPYLYYGEEIGMLSEIASDQVVLDSTSALEPFVWDEGEADKVQTTGKEAEHSTDRSVIPLSKQKAEESSLYNFYKKLIHYRNGNGALTYGDIDYAGFKSGEIVGFIRKHEEDEVLVLHNVSDVEITLSLNENLSRFNEIDFDTVNGKVAISNNEIKMPAYATAILKQG